MFGQCCIELLWRGAPWTATPVVMEADRSRIDEFVSAVGLRAAELPHPVDLITVAAAADRGNVAVSTVDSAIRSADSFRHRVLAAAVRSVDSEPGPRCWDALRQIVADASDSPGRATIVALFAARSAELAEDPAIPLLLSAFDRLDIVDVSSAANDVLRALVRRFWPLVATAEAALGVETPPQPTDRQAYALIFALLADTRRRLHDLDVVSLEEQIRLSTPLAGLVHLEATRPGCDQSSMGHGFLRAPVPASPPPGLAAAAVDAGTELLLDYAVPIATSVSVAEAVARANSSKSHFYKLFGSVERFDRALVVNAGREITSVLPENIFDSTLTIVREGDLTLEQAFDVLWDHYLPFRTLHVKYGRPGREMTPWLGSDVVQPVIARAHHEACAQRAPFYAELIEAAGPRLPEIDEREMGGIMDCAGVVLELLVRNAPNRRAATATIDEFFANVVGAICGPP